MSFINFNFYSFTCEEELSVEAEVEYKEPDYNDNFSDLDFHGGYDILSLDIYHEDGEEVKPNGENFTAICAQLTEAESEKDKGGFLTWVFNEFGSLSTEYKKKLDDAKKKSSKSTSTKRK